MIRLSKLGFLLGLILSVGLAPPDAWGDEQESTDPGHATTAEKSLQVANLVLAKHIDPPTRQEMILAGVRQLFSTHDVALPTGLAAEISTLTADEELSQFLVKMLQQVQAESKRPTDQPQLDDALVLAHGMLGIVPGGASLTNSKEHRVNEQLAENRYVGTGIVLHMNDKKKLPVMAQVFEDGPADKVGALDGDFIEKINGESTFKVSLVEIVQLLRGPAGSTVDVTLRQPGSDDARDYTITRGVVPIKTVIARTVTVKEAPIAYLKLDRITGSAVHELRKQQQELIDENTKGVILDFRGLSSGSAHHAVLISDALLDNAPIGHIRSRTGVKPFQASRDMLFADLPMAVLVDQRTVGSAEWLAAALQDNKRAIVVGTRTYGGGYNRGTFPIWDGDIVVSLSTGILERPDGRRLVKPRATATPPGMVAEMMALQQQKVSWAVEPDHNGTVNRRNAVARAYTALENSMTPKTDQLIMRAARLLLADKSQNSTENDSTGDATEG